MQVDTFLARLGWPEDRSREAGQARWSGVGADGLSELRATLSVSHDGSSIKARIDAVGLSGSEEMLKFEARVTGDVVVVTRAQVGAPPEKLPAEDAVHLFCFMREGLAQFKFSSTGPRILPVFKRAQ